MKPFFSPSSPMSRNLPRCLSTLLIGLALSGCGGGGGDSPAPSRVRDMAAGLSEGEFELTFSGQVTTVGPAEEDREPADFFPSNITANRERNDGFGGRTAVETSNATGPYRVQLWQEIRRGEEDPGTGRVWIQLPANARAGQTYRILDSRRGGDGEAYGGVVGAAHGWSINRNLEGEIHIGEIGETLTASFHLHNGAEPDSENRLDVAGRMNRISFRPRTEAAFTRVHGGETLEAVRGTIRQDRPTNYLISVQGAFAVEFDGPPQPGAYSISRRRSPGVVSLNFDGISLESVEGTLEVREDGDMFHMSYRATGTDRDSQPVTLEGTLSQVPPSEH